MQKNDTPINTPPCQVQCKREPSALAAWLTRPQAALSHAHACFLDLASYQSTRATTMGLMQQHAATAPFMLLGMSLILLTYAQATRVVVSAQAVCKTNTFTLAYALITPPIRRTIGCSLQP